jgi:hypothetical protein
MKITPNTLGALTLAAGALILAHQLITWQRIDITDILHHEWFAGVLLAFSLGVYLALRHTNLKL